MIPYSYNMVDMSGIDLAEAHGTVVEGLYNRLALARNACGDLILYNWKFAEIEIAPGICTTLDVGSSILINGLIQVTEQDEVYISGIVPEPVISSLQVTENGVYTPPTGIDGYAPVTVNVDTDPLNWRDSFAVNWDFSHPVNTRGASSYSNSSLIYTIDGWQLQGGTLELTTGGIRLSRYAAETAGFFMQRFKTAMTAAIVGRTMTLSAMVDGEVAFATADPVPSASGSSGFSFYCGGVAFRGYGYGTEIAITIDIATDTSDHILQAIKLEAGNTQTLATQVNGVWVLNNTMDAATEYIKARDGTVYN